MGQYIQGGGFRGGHQGPDIRDILALLQYASPERQQEQQLGLEEAKTRLAGYTQDNQQKAAAAPLTLDQLRASIGAQQAQTQHEQAGTQFTQAQMQHLPAQYQQEGDLNAAQIGHITNEDRLSNAAETRAQSMFPIQQATAQTGLDSAKQALGFSSLENPLKLGLEGATTAHVNAETDLLKHDPHRAMERLMFAHQAMADPSLANIVSDSDPLVGQAIQAKKAGQDQALQGVTDAITALHNPLANSSTNPSTANAVGQYVNDIPTKIANLGYNVGPALSHGVSTPVVNLVRGMFGYDAIQPTPYRDFATDAAAIKRKQQGQ